MNKRTATKRGEADWIEAGGKAGETAHCNRCGEGLVLGTQPLPVAIAAINAFTKMHSRCKPRPFKEPDPKTLHEWARGRDTGVSSATIYSAATGEYSPYGKYDVPHDPADFGRCYRLLKLFPDVATLLPKTIRYCAGWKPFVEHWAELTQMYEEELPLGSAPKLYERIKELGG